MKKLLGILLALTMLLAACAVSETSASPAEPLPEGSMLFHGYISEAAGYYVGVPAEWALVGAFSHPENLDEACKIMDEYEVKQLHSTLSAENDILFAFSESGEQMVLVYGPSDGVTSDVLIEEAGALKRMLTAEYVGITFEDDCGSYTINDLVEVLYIGCQYNGNTIYQYYIPAGKNIYVFTFVNVEKIIAQSVISTFNLNAK